MTRMTKIDATLGARRMWRSVPQCSPSTAAVDLPKGTYAQTITHPGSYQWFRFNYDCTHPCERDPGPPTYSFSVNAQVKMELKDLHGQRPLH